MTNSQLRLAEAMKRSQNASTKRKLVRVSKCMIYKGVTHYTATLLVMLQHNLYTSAKRLLKCFANL